MALLLAFLLALQPVRAPFTAHWDGPLRSRFTWSQPPDIRQTCLFRVPASQSPILIRCWSDVPAGPTVARIGDVGPLDAAYRPQSGDRYLLTMDGAIERAQLRGVVLLPIMRR